MPKVSVYLPDDLYRQARERDLSISALAQDAIVAELRRTGSDRWIDAVRRRPRRLNRTVDTSALIDEVRGGFGA